MKRLLRTLAFVAFLAAASAILAEVAVRVFDLFARQRTFVGAGIGEPGSELAGARAAQWPIVIHPFLGWSRRSGLDRAELEGRVSSSEWVRRNARTNLFGFYSETWDYRELDALDFVVGVFGGSVASELVILGGETLAAGLVEDRVAEADRIRILNLGLGGYKQPQQLNLLGQMMLLGVPFDVVINLDGFNEAAIGAADASEGFHPLLPSRFHWGSVVALTGGLLPREVWLRIAEIERWRRRRDFLLESVRGSRALALSELARAIAGLGGQACDARAASLEYEVQRRARDASANAVAEVPLECDEGKEGCHELISELWTRGSIAMKALAESQGALYVHFLQPNQYVPGSKPLSAEEIDTAIDAAHPWSQAVPGGYAALRARAAALRSGGVAFYDLSQLFQGETRTLYRDTCCHYNEQGNVLLAGEMSKIVARLVSETARGS
jgi:hypothetical protein